MNLRPGFTFLNSHLEVLHTFLGSLKNIDSGPAPISRLHGLFFFPILQSVGIPLQNGRWRIFVRKNIAQNSTKLTTLNLRNHSYLEPL